MRYNSWYLLFPSSEKQQREMTKFCVDQRTWTMTADFLIFVSNVSACPRFSFVMVLIPNKGKWLKRITKLAVNPLTPMLAVTGRDKPWPFFHFWPKFASSMLNFCRRRRSFQWCPDQSDGPSGAWDMHKNAQKVERKTQTKICCHHTWLLHGKSCPSRWCFPGSFLTASKPSRRSITAAKRKEKEKKERPKKNSKNQKSLKT